MPLGGAVVPVAVLASIVFYTALDSVFLQAFAGQRFVYALAVLVSGAAAVYSLSGLTVSRRELMLLSAWFTLNFIWLLAVFAQSTVYPTWVIGDMASMMLPLLLFLVACRYPKIFVSRGLVTCLWVFLLFAAVIGAVLNVSPNTRFEAPTTLLFPIVWLDFSLSRGTRKLLIGCALMLLAVLAIGSGERTAMILWVLSGLLAYGLVWSWKRLATLGIAALLLAVVFGSAILQAGLIDALEQTRFRENIGGGVDASLLTRINEAQDVVLAFQNAGPLQQIFGHGHGASFRPVHSLTEQNITDDGLVHHVHIGPAMVIYRYGLVGLTVVLWLWVAVIRNLLRQRALGRQKWAILDAAMGMAMLMYLIDFFLFNVIPKPAFSYVIAAFMFLESRHRIIRLRPTFDLPKTEFAR